jgi:hypothetical protein
MPMAEPFLVKLLKKAFHRRTLTARLSRAPVLGGLIDNMLFDGDNMIYLPKDRVIQINKPVERLGEMVLPSQVAEHFIETANHHWIMDWCICRESMTRKG